MISKCRQRASFTGRSPCFALASSRLQSREAVATGPSLSISELWSAHLEEFMLSLATSTNRIGHLLISIAALLAACDCQGAVGEIEDRAAGQSSAVESDTQPDSMPVDCSVRRQNQLASSACEAHRSRGGRGRRGYLSDLLDYLYGTLLWLRGTVANAG